MIISAEHTVVIDRPAHEVFEFVADQRNEPRWHADVVEVRPETRLELGSRVTWVVKFMGEQEYTTEVTAFDDDRLIELTTQEGPMKPILTHTFSASNGSTRYTRRVQIPAEGMFKVVGPIMRATGAAHRRNARFAENLKELLQG